MTDLIIIGAGPGGYELALEARKNNLTTILIEGKKLGGTCLWEGCIPTKVYYKNASFLKDLKEAHAYGVSFDNFTFDFKETLTRKEQVINDLGKGIDFLLKKAGVVQIQGYAQLTKDHKVLVNDEVYEAKNIVIATGSKPFMLSSFKGVLSSTDLLALDYVPQKLVVIGGGVIGIEMAAIYSHFGSSVEVVEGTSSILGLADSDIYKRSLAFLKAQRIKFHLNAKAISYENNIVTIEDKDGIKELVADECLMAIGRIPNLSDLNLDEAGIKYERRGIITNEFGQTNIPNIYAIGDVTGKMMLAHYATFDGYRVLDHILGKKNQTRFDLVPSCVFTFPEIAWCGLTEKECLDQNLEYQVNKTLFRQNGKALTMNEVDGFVKTITSNGKIKGVHIIGPHASSLIHEMSSLMNKDITKDEFLSIIHAHPTLSEIFHTNLK